MKANKRTISCEYVYTDINFSPLARLLAERFMRSKKMEALSDEIKPKTDNSTHICEHEL